MACSLKHCSRPETLTNLLAGSKPTPALLSTPHVKFFYLAQLPHFFLRLPFLILAPVKIIHQALTILITLMFTIPNTPEFIIVQVRIARFHIGIDLFTVQKNPPSIPTLVVVWLVSRVRPTKVIIDWHNLGYTILALKLGESHPVVGLAKM
jgi:beta-1,4-mannosyltransferase